MPRTLPWLARVGAAYGRKLLRVAGASAARIIGETEPPRRPIMTMQGEAPLGTRVVVFCHFNPHGRLREHVRRYIMALAEAELSSPS